MEKIKCPMLMIDLILLFSLHKDVCRKEKKRKETLRKQQKAPHINKGKGATWKEKPLHQKEKGGVSEDQDICRIFTGNG